MLLDHLEISVRAAHSLKAAGITTAEQYLSLTKEEKLAIEGMLAKHHSEVAAAIKGKKATAKVVKSSNRGSKPGERRGGRKKGTPNKATASIRDAAREYTQDALNALVAVLQNEQEPAAARVSAANSILDRGYGKASTVLTGDEDGGPVKAVHKIELIGVPANREG